MVACSNIVLPYWPPHPDAPQVTDDMEVRGVMHSWFVFGTVEEAADDVDYIFRGTAISERVDWLIFYVEIKPDDSPRLVTITEFEVTEVFKGNLVPGDIFEIYQIGGIDESHNVTLQSEDRVELAIGEDFVVFAFCTFRVFEEDERRYTFPNAVLAPMQAFHWVASERTGRGMAMDSTASVVNDGVIISRPDNPFTLTREDLVRIAEENGHEVGRDISVASR